MNSAREIDNLAYSYYSNNACQKAISEDDFWDELLNAARKCGLANYAALLRTKYKLSQGQVSRFTLLPGIEERKAVKRPVSKKEKKPKETSRAEGANQMHDSKRPETKFIDKVESSPKKRRVVRQHGFASRRPEPTELESNITYASILHDYAATLDQIKLLLKYTLPNRTVNMDAYVKKDELAVLLKHFGKQVQCTTLPGSPKKKGQLNINRPSPSDSWKYVTWFRPIYTGMKN